ncbi:MAG: hypothetical protein ABWX63_11090 [Paeniglutamicibacter terrestris]
MIFRIHAADGESKWQRPPKAVRVFVKVRGKQLRCSPHAQGTHFAANINSKIFQPMELVSMKRIFSLLLALALLCGLSGCSADERAERISAGWTEALLTAPGVIDARSSYHITPGMSQGGMVQVTMKPGDRTPEEVMANSMRALAPLLIKNDRRSAGLNYSLVVEGSDTLVYPEILGIDSRPSLQTIIDYAAENPAP